jgi:hypothetical protein
MKALSTLALLATLPAALLLQSTPAHALVRVVAICNTSADLRVTLLDNQGIGFERSSHFGASVYDQQGHLLASYEVLPERIGSISFGRMHYRDQQSGGQQFDLAFGSTNFHNITLSAVLKDGTVIEDENLNCRPENE